MRGVYEAGSEIRCIAEGNPPPTYTWQKLTYPPIVISTDSILTLVIIDEEENQETYVCIARNMVGGKERKANVTAYITIKGLCGCFIWFAA